MTAVHPRPPAATVTIYWFDDDRQLRRDASTGPVDVHELFADAPGVQSRPIQDGSGAVIGIATRTQHLEGL